MAKGRAFLAGCATGARVAVSDARRRRWSRVRPSASGSAAANPTPLGGPQAPQAPVPRAGAGARANEWARQSPTAATGRTPRDPSLDAPAATEREPLAHFRFAW